MFLISRRKSFPLWVKNTFFETNTSVPSTPPPQILQPPSAESSPRSGQMVWLASPCCWPLVPAQQSGAAAKQMENSGELKNPEICRGDSAGKKKKHVFSELFVPIRCNFSLLVTLDVSVCLICPMWFQCRCWLQSRVNYIYFVMLASLFLHFISNQSACVCACVCVWTPLYLYWYYYYHQLQFAAIKSPRGSSFTARLCCPHNFINRKSALYQDLCLKTNNFSVHMELILCKVEIISTLSCVLSDLCSS